MKKLDTNALFITLRIACKRCGHDYGDHSRVAQEVYPGRMSTCHDRDHHKGDYCVCAGYLPDFTLAARRERRTITELKWEIKGAQKRIVVIGRLRKGQNQ